MRYSWVDQNQTFRQEIAGGYLGSPKRNANGGRKMATGVTGRPSRNVSEVLIQFTPELSIEMPRCRVPCRSWL